MNIFFELSFRDLDKNYLSGLVRNFDGRQKDSHVILINLFNGSHFFSLTTSLSPMLSLTTPYCAIG